MQQLGAEDAAFVYLDAPPAPMHVGLLGIYDPSTAPGGHVRFKTLLGHIGDRLAHAPAFRRRLVRLPLDLDDPYWIEDPDFDIEHHVRHIALPAPADWRQLCIQVSRLHARPIDLNRPLWEFTIIEGLDRVEGLPAGCFALFAKTHLAAIDQQSGDRMIAAIHDPDIVPLHAGSVDNWKPDSRPGITDLLVSNYFNTLRKPFQFAETLTRSLPDLARRGAAKIRRQTEPHGGEAAPPTPFDGVVGPHRVFDSIDVPVDELGRIGALAPGSTVDDVILTIVGGALHIYLSADDRLPDASLSALHVVEAKPMTVTLATHLDDAVARLRYIASAAGRLRAKLDPSAGGRTRFAPALAGAAARLQVQHAAGRSGVTTINTVVAQMPGRLPGAAGDSHIGGATLVRLHGLMPVVDSIGLAHTTFETAGRMTISFTADRAMMPDPAAYRLALQHSFDALKSAADLSAASIEPARQKAAPQGGATTTSRKKERADG